MTDQERTEARVRVAFAAELRRAEADVEMEAVQVSRPGAARVRSWRPAVGAAAVVALIAGAVGAGLLVGAPRTAAPSATATSRPSLAGDRYEDGIPRTWQGQPVIRWNDALALRETAKDATPFLAAVWLNMDELEASCPAFKPDPSGVNSWIDPSGCDQRAAGSEAGGPADGLNGVATFRFLNGSATSGPAILRVHVHDPRATECGSKAPQCSRLIVIEQVLWAGDSLTDPQPFTTADVIAAVRSVEPTATCGVDRYGIMGGAHIPLAGVLAISCGDGPLPADMQVEGAYVMPSAAAVSRFLPGVQPGAAGAMLPTAQRGGLVGGGDGGAVNVVEHWLVVDNVAISVLTGPDVTDADKAWVAGLEAALKATH
jgi:hypothetical protein